MYVYVFYIFTIPRINLIHSFFFSLFKIYTLKFHNLWCANFKNFAFLHDFRADIKSCFQNAYVKAVSRIKWNNIGRISNIDDTRRSITNGVVGVSALQHSVEGLGSWNPDFRKIVQKVR